MKNLLSVLCLSAALTSGAQAVSGLYTGKLVNDTTKKTLMYEMALSEYRGKITGYSYTTYLYHDTLYYSVKSVTAVKKDDQLIVTDDKMIVNNFPEAPARHVHQTNYIQLHNEDTLRQANGKWETNRTRRWDPLGGAMRLKRDDDSSHSALIGQLKELKIITEEDRHINNSVAETKIKIKEEPKTTTEKVVSKEKTTTKPAHAVVTKPEPPAVLPYAQRKNNLMQTVDVSSDSLVLSFYDNGIVDGDSISVYVNGKNVVSNSKLLAVATRKSIDISHLGDQVEIIVVAENLGTIPPNTGLVVIQDGDQQYQVNFTADMQTNASIVLHRKRR